MNTGSTEIRRRGRPLVPDEKAKRYAVGIRTTKEMKDLLQQAADSSGRSLAQEIELRLERSFMPERTFDERLIDMYGRQGAALMHMLGRIIRAAPTSATSVEEEWLEEPFSCAHAAALLGALASRLGDINPIGNAIHPLNHDLDEKRTREEAERTVNHMLRALSDSSVGGWFADRRKEFGEHTLTRLKVGGAK